MTAGKTKKNSILLVIGDEEIQKYTYAKEGSAYWSAAFGAILEKNGYLAFDTASHSVLAEPGRLGAYDILILAALPAERWTDRMVAGLAGFAGVTIVEGPVPEALYGLCGIESVSEAGETGEAGEAPADIEILDPDIAAFVRDHYHDILPTGRPFFAGKTIQTRPVRFNRWDFDFDPGAMTLEDWAHRLVRYVAVPSLARIRSGNLVPTVKDTLFACIFLLLVRGKNGDVGDGDAAAIRAAVEAARGQAETAEERRLLAAADALSGACGAPPPAEGGPATALASRPLSGIDRLALALAEDAAGIAPLSEAALGAMLAEYVTVRGPADEAAKPVLLREVGVIAWGLARRGRRRAAETLLRRIVEEALDHEDGTLTNLRFRGAGAERIEGQGFHVHLGFGFLAVLDTAREAPFIGETFAETYGAAYIDGWAAAPLTVGAIRPLSGAAGAEPVLALRRGDGTVPVAVRNGRVLAFSFQVLALIAHAHTMHPLDGPFTDYDASPAIVLEPTLFALLATCCRAAEIPLFRVAPWPAGYRYCCTIRHDVDRIATDETFDDLMAFETERGLGVSWYWIFNRLRPDQIKRQVAAGHEVALHALKHERKEAELAALAAVLGEGYEIKGEFLHGGGGGEYWLGHPTVAAAEAAGFLYTEGVSTLYDFPYRWPWLREDGVIDCIDIICLSHSVSVDSRVPDEGQPLWNKWRVAAMVRTGAYVTVLNHPDDNLARLVRIVDQELPEEGRLNWTCAQVAEWWRATHCREALRMRWNGAELSVDGDYPVEGLVVEISGDADIAAGEAGRPADTAADPLGIPWRRVALDLVPGKAVTLARRPG